MFCDYIFLDFVMFPLLLDYNIQKRKDIQHWHKMESTPFKYHFSSTVLDENTEENTLPNDLFPQYQIEKRIGT